MELRGACPPGITACADSDASLSDQLYRARLLGAPGLALAIEQLETIANQAGALDAEDSAVLRWWVMTARERPLRLYFDSHDETLGIYTAPTQLGTFVRDAEQEDLRPSVPPPVNQQLYASLRSMHPMTEFEDEDFADSPIDENPEPSEPPDFASGNEASVLQLAGASAAIDAGESNSKTVSMMNTVAQMLEYSDKQTGADNGADTPDCSTIVGESAVEPLDSPQPGPALGPPLHPDAAKRWREWMHLLDEARGPKPLGVVEQLYVNAYVPLADAVARDIADSYASDVLSTWSVSFARSYNEAFDALRLRGKRPMMVFDIADVALRLARLHGARSVQLVLVDGLRFDLGLRIEERMRKSLGQQAAMTERLLLWSALPSNTATQLELLGRGPDGLKDFKPPAESNAFVAHGRASALLRRVRTGSRDVMKLDMVEARLSEPGVGSPAGLDCLADEVAPVLSSALLKFAPRTLAVVFGDHGFLADPKDGWSSPARHGGSSPEEVLVPAFAWLIGATH